MDYKSLGDYLYYNEPIGQGSFSLIYKGYRLKDRKPIAIKKITRFIEQKYIDSEINLMKKLDNDNILKLYEVIQQGSSLYLILEYCNNGDLGQYIETKNTEQDLSFIYQIICGLKYLYKNNILHRDIKPQNILVSGDKIKICGFGFAKNLAKNDLISTFCGSPLYMAPEILKIGEYTEKSDIWSLGVIIYEILHKKHPYPSNSQGELIKNIKNENNIFVELKNIDENLTKLVNTMLIKDPDLRISWDGIFNSEWLRNVDRGINKFGTKAIDIPNSNNEEKCSDEEFLFTMDEDIEISGNKKTVSFSVDHTSKDTFFSNRTMDVSRSTFIPNHKIDVKTKKYDDTKVYSRSAPDAKSSILMENYISKKVNSSIKEDRYNIVGVSPNIKDSGGWYNSLNKSVNTIKNFFNL